MHKRMLIVTDSNDLLSGAQSPASPNAEPSADDAMLPREATAFGGHEAAELAYAADELALKQPFSREAAVAPEIEPDELALLAAQQQARELYAIIAPDPRIALFSDAIKRHPDAAINYVLRAEVYLELRNRESAVEDFLTAILLSEDKETDWEYINRSILDRARQGLRRCGFSV
jgi:tetratricopeptide (TPR) repeat protein